MRSARRLGVPLLLLVFASMVTGLVDAAGRSGLMAQNVAAPLILACLLAVTMCVGAASSNHLALVVNTAVAAAVAVVARMALAAVASG
jgi:hypothetical protein